MVTVNQSRWRRNKDIKINQIKPISSKKKEDGTFALPLPPRYDMFHFFRAELVVCTFFACLPGDLIHDAGAISSTV